MKIGSWLNWFRDRPTHGRWVKVAAASAVPSAAAVALSSRRLGPEATLRRAALPALLCHQTEEWFWPAGFLEWFNPEVLRSREKLRPLTPRDGVFINVGLGWAPALAAAAAGERYPGLEILVHVMDFGNAGLHIGWAARNGSYDPGLATSLLLFAPLSAVRLPRLLRDPEIPRAQKLAGVGVGLAAAASMIAIFKYHVRSQGLSR